jgi:UDP-N-acetylmuramoyl-L-alanyl-D-glutamate--2,6-diaminopimelate ligase
VAGSERPTERTTPEALELQATFAEMLAGGDTACTMEVSSHALALHRTDAIHWAVAVFTNLTQDHLDFHDGMEDYFAAKRRLFAAAEGTTVTVVNVDDAYGARLAAELEDAVTVGFSEGAALRAQEVTSDASGATFTLDGREWRICLPGRFNVLNALCAIAAARALGLGDDQIAAALPAGAVPGRFEPVDEGQGFTVLVDYSHTPDSLENALRAARELTGERVYCVFGAGGDRDRAKRPLMGRVAAELADVAIVTSDNPRSEDPEAIIAEVQAGMDGHGQAIVDRREAIFHAIRLAEGGDVVLIAGKGHEQGQELAGGEKVPFDDVAVAREALRDRLVI